MRLSAIGFEKGPTRGQEIIKSTSRAVFRGRESGGRIDEAISKSIAKAVALQNRGGWSDPHNCHSASENKCPEPNSHCRTEGGGVTPTTTTRL